MTIFGESAGGASVEFQVLSPRAKGDFATTKYIRNNFPLSMII